MKLLYEENGDIELQLYAFEIYLSISIGNCMFENLVFEASES